MDLLFFLTPFVTFSLLFVILATIQEERILLRDTLIDKLSENVLILFKIIPALLATIFVALNPLNDQTTTTILIIAFIACFFADIAIEKMFLVGMILFLLAQIFLTSSFLLLSYSFGIEIETIVLFIVLFLLMLLYVYFLLRYLTTSEKGLGKFRNPVIVYSLAISLMLVSTIILYFSSSKPDVLIIIVGAILFIISDSFIAIREFHHKYRFSELVIMPTYYGALLLLSMVVTIF